jgi:hypothetical protein
MSFTPIAHEASALALSAQKGKEFLSLFNGDVIEIAMQHQQGSVDLRDAENRAVAQVTIEIRLGWSP